MPASLRQRFHIAQNIRLFLFAQVLTGSGHFTGTFNDDFLAFKDPGFQRADLCTLILRAWPHPDQPLSSQGTHA